MILNNDKPSNAHQPISVIGRPFTRLDLNVWPGSVII